MDTRRPAFINFGFQNYGQEVEKSFYSVPDKDDHLSVEKKKQGKNYPICRKLTYFANL